MTMMTMMKWRRLDHWHGSWLFLMCWYYHSSEALLHPVKGEGCICCTYCPVQTFKTVTALISGLNKEGMPWIVDSVYVLTLSSYSLTVQLLPDTE